MTKTAGQKERTYDAVAIGELLVDFTETEKDEWGYPTLAAHPGGAPANFLAAIGKFGGKTALIGKVGSDPFGKMLKKTLRSSGIDDSSVVEDQNFFTTLAFVTLSQSGERSFTFSRKPGADTQLSEKDIDFSMIAHTRLLHFGTLSLTHEPARSATYRAVEFAKKAEKLISFDPNYREPLWNSQAEAKKQMEYGLRFADIVKISDNEAELLWGLSPERAAKRLIEYYGAKLTFVTCGEKGCVYANANALGTLPALPGIPVRDTTGAGDIFGGSAVWKLLQSGKAPETLSGAELHEIAMFATAAAGLSTTRAGGIPSIPEYNEILQAQQILASVFP